MRDTLIFEGKFELALQLSAKYNLKSDSVWAAWGLSLLQEGKLELAREKFKYCFGKYLSFSKKQLKKKNIQNKKVSESSKKNSSLILNSILKCLHTVIPTSPKETESQDVASSISFQQRFDESVYYLSTYGNTQKLLNFWVGHKKFDQLLEFSLKSHGTQNSIEEVLNSCKELNLFNDLHEAIKQKGSKKNLHFLFLIFK